MVDISIIVAVVFGIIAIYQAQKANKLQHRVAEAEGTFEKPDIHVNVYGNANVEEIIWSLPIPKDSVIEVPLKYQIRNHGGKSTEKLEIYSTMPKELHYRGCVDPTFEFPPIKEIKSGVTKDEPYVHTLGSSISSLFRHQGIEFEDWISIWKGTSLRSKVNATSKDGIGLEIGYVVHYAYAIDLVIMQENLPEIKKHFSLSVIDTSKDSLEIYFRERNKNYTKESRGFVGSRNFLLNQCEFDDLDKVNETPIYRVRNYKTYEGIEDSSLGLTIPALGIRPIPENKET